MKTIKQIQRENAAFKKMTRPQKRVVVAKDILTMLRLKIVDTSSVGYFRAPERFLSKQLSYIVTEKFKPPCVVCAKGAMVVACLLKNNFEIELQDIRGDNYNDVKELFSKKEFDLIEEIFEEFGCNGMQSWTNEDDLLKALHWDRNDKLKAICAYYIKHKGEFLSWKKFKAMILKKGFKLPI